MAGETGGSGGKKGGVVRLPAPTAWPFVFAFGLALVFAGMATAGSVSGLGAILALAWAVGWFRDLLPHEAHQAVEVAEEAPAVVSSRREVARLEIARELARAYLPVETYPVSAGIKGGIAGGVAMALLAMLYGVVSRHGIWYPINLLSAGFFPAASTESTAQLETFQASAFSLAFGIHLVTSLVVGLLYGAMLPMLSRRPVLLGGVIAPVMWTGLLHAILGIINPVLDARVDWFWFVISQVGFGLVAGVLVSRQHRVPTWQATPLALRAGIEASGLLGEDHGKGPKR
ncbi:MAG TPA: hypothetical protein VEJ89_02040 [Myxococcaceae bacterium]|nr:hypothetical protein [Myxococcaceae bacterium]